ncbi:DUF5994 family protein [Streptomyces sp. NPDC007205]|uniref:DUF5994 family protein n=1 Tax=Streptomyces sp. NPDC007205 TaxID=3154316 RepID=UPI0033F09E9F
MRHATPWALTAGRSSRPQVPAPRLPLAVRGEVSALFEECRIVHAYGELDTQTVVPLVRAAEEHRPAEDDVPRRTTRQDTFMTNDRLRPPPPAPPLLRLYLAPESTLPRRIDGAWWPRASGLAAELEQLLCGLPRGWGRIVSVLVNGTVWAGAPSRMLVCDRVVRLRGATRANAPSTIVLMAPGHGRRDLLVLPPQATERAAASLLSAAGLTPEPGRSPS